MLPGGTALTTIDQPVQYDLSRLGLNQSIGWVIEGIFQEIDIATGQVMFEWHSIDHVDPIDSYTTFGSKGLTNGTTPADGWDYL